MSAKTWSQSNIWNGHSKSASSWYRNGTVNTPSCDSSIYPSPRMLLAISVSAEDECEDGVDVPRVKGGTASVAVVEAIDAASSSETICTAVADLTPVVLEYIQPIFPIILHVEGDQDQALRAEGLKQFRVTSTQETGLRIVRIYLARNSAALVLISVLIIQKTSISPSADEHTTHSVDMRVSLSSITLSIRPSWAKCGVLPSSGKKISSNASLQRQTRLILLYWDLV